MSTLPVPGSLLRLPGLTTVQLEAAGLDGVVGGPLGLEVRAHGAGALDVLHPDRGDDHEAVHAQLARGLHALDGRAEVDGLLALRPAAGPGARREHDRLRAADVRAQVIVLEIAEHGDGAVGHEVGGVVGVADQPAGVVAVGGEDSVEPAGNLSVASGDEDVHGVRRTQVTAASTTRPPVICVADSA